MEYMLEKKKIRDKNRDLFKNLSKDEQKKQRDLIKNEKDKNKKSEYIEFPYLEDLNDT